MPRGHVLAPAVIALLAGLHGALILLGPPAPVRADRLPEAHAILMVLGFVGTLIALERALDVAHGGRARPLRRRKRSARVCLVADLGDDRRRRGAHGMVLVTP